MKIEINRFMDGRLKVKVVFESNTNFWKETLTWVPTWNEIELIFLTLLGVDGINRLRRKFGR